MKRILPVLCLAATVLLSGCGVEGAAPWRKDASEDGPPKATAPVSESAAELADRYGTSGGDKGVYGISHAKDESGVLVLTVRTRKKDGYEPFDDFATHLAAFLAAEDVRLDKGYVLNVYGPDGVRLHNYSTVVENTP
ncbi:hypothetical protein AB0B50_15310 [Streptomyces sp. NPDC041068]|uniref:hypothetical protein n=1 Tax=Streptomyces sp. NPDC041068 TaxID=3155130 RepID=UPI0033DE3A79